MATNPRSGHKSIPADSPELHTLTSHSIISGVATPSTSTTPAPAHPLMSPGLVASSFMEELSLQDPDPLHIPTATPFSSVTFPVSPSPYTLYACPKCLATLTLLTTTEYGYTRKFYTRLVYQNCKTYSESLPELLRPTFNKLYNLYKPLNDPEFHTPGNACPGHTLDFPGEDAEEKASHHAALYCVQAHSVNRVVEEACNRHRLCYCCGRERIGQFQDPESHLSCMSQGKTCKHPLTSPACIANTCCHPYLPNNSLWHADAFQFHLQNSPYSTKASSFYSALSRSFGFRCGSSSSAIHQNYNRLRKSWLQTTAPFFSLPMDAPGKLVDAHRCSFCIRGTTPLARAELHIRARDARAPRKREFTAPSPLPSTCQILLPPIYCIGQAHLVPSSTISPPPPPAPPTTTTHQARNRRRRRNVAQHPGHFLQDTALILQEMLSFGESFRHPSSHSSETPFLDDWGNILNIGAGHPPTTTFQPTREDTTVRHHYNNLVYTLKRHLQAGCLAVLSVDKGPGMVILSTNLLDALYGQYSRQLCPEPTTTDAYLKRLLINPLEGTPKGGPECKCGLC